MASKLQKTKTGQYLLTIPRNLVEALGWTKGQAVKITIEGKSKLGISA